MVHAQRVVAQDRVVVVLRRVGLPGVHDLRVPEQVPVGVAGQLDHLQPFPLSQEACLATCYGWGYHFLERHHDYHDFDCDYGFDFGLSAYVLNPWIWTWISFSFPCLFEVLIYCVCNNRNLT